MVNLKDPVEGVSILAIISGIATTVITMTPRVLAVLAKRKKDAVGEAQRDRGLLLLEETRFREHMIAELKRLQHEVQDLRNANTDKEQKIRRLESEKFPTQNRLTQLERQNVYLTEQVKQMAIKLRERDAEVQAMSKYTRRGGPYQSEATE